MNNSSQGLLSCRNISWIVGGLIGLIAFILIRSFWGLLVGIAVAIALALVLQRLFCSGAGAGNSGVTAAASTGEPTGGAAPAQADRAGSAEATAAREAEAQRAADAQAARAAEAAADAARAAEAEAEAAQAKADAAADAALAEVAEPAQDYDGDGVLEGEGEGSRPEALAAARGGKADDLKLIKGIGPKLEQLCNELGFYHWDQIAGWTPAEVAWVNANLKGFKGRVTRDNWVEQAKVLAAGGTTEFAERAEKTGLYDTDKS